MPAWDSSRIAAIFGDRAAANKYVRGRGVDSFVEGFPDIFEREHMEVTPVGDGLLRVELDYRREHL